MPTPEQQQLVSEAIEAIRSAQGLLAEQIDVADDTWTSIRLTQELGNLDAHLSELLRAQNAADDAELGQATQSFKSRSGGLELDEKRIKSIVKNEATALKIAGYLAKALTAVGGL